MNIKWKDDNSVLHLVGVEAVKNGIWPSFKLTVVRIKSEPLAGLTDVDIFEVTVLKEQMAYEVVKNDKMLSGSYYPDAGKESNTMPQDLFQQVIRVVNRF